MATPLEILVVDDQDNIAMLIQKGLHRRRVGNVHVADGASQAEEVARERELDVLVVDFDMPGGNGLELFARLKKEGQDTTGILMSGMLTKPIRELAEDLGFSAMLTKPFDLDELVRAIEAARRPAPESPVGPAV